MTGTPMLALWGMPRSRSTAFFRMMAERGDFQVVHEPFSNLAEFGAKRVGDAVARTETALIAAIRRLALRGPVFFKDTTDERYARLLADSAFLGTDCVHTFLIRHPAETIASYHAINPRVGLHQVGAGHLYEIHERVAELTGRRPVVIDAADLMADPPGMMRAYCAAVGIPYRAEALTWQPGHRPEWRATASWHEDVSTSGGFAPVPRRHDVDVTAHPVLSRHLAHHLPYYLRLREHRLQA